MYFGIYFKSVKIKPGQFQGQQYVYTITNILQLQVFMGITCLSVDKMVSVG